MSQAMNLLLSSAGRRVALLQALRLDAQGLGIALRVLAADLNPSQSAACASADIAFAVPRCTEAGFIDSLVDHCHRHQVGLVIPTIDTELPVLSEARARFEPRCKIAVSSHQAVLVARDKQATADVLSTAGIPTPGTAPLGAVLAGDANVGEHMVLKRVDGSRSIGLHYVDSREAARRLGLEPSRYVAQERCIGPEYTVNCYVDQKGVLRAAVPHRRIEVRDGEVSKGVTERRADLTAIAHKIVAAIPGLRGPFCFQAILTSDGPKVFEINARFGGGYPLAHAAGATFGKWLMEEALGLPCTANDEWQDGLLMLRYDAAVFIKQ